MSARPNYGIDSPAIVGGFFSLCLVSVAAAVAVYYFAESHPYILTVLFAASLYFFLSGSGMLLYSRFGKLRIRDQVLESIEFRGDEVVLDVGCGRGLLLVGAARRLTTGKAIGVDRWLKDALSGNTSDALLANARLEGVFDRVEVREGDVRQLPFEDASFDVVLSNFVVHEVDTAAEREQMLREIVRVLRPGGRIALVDFIFTGQCSRLLGEMGINSVERSRVGSFFSFWLRAILNFGLVQTYLVCGTKSAGRSNTTDVPR